MYKLEISQVKIVKHCHYYKSMFTWSIGVLTDESNFLNLDESGFFFTNVCTRFKIIFIIVHNFISDLSNADIEFV